MRRHDLTEDAWMVIQSKLPTKVGGGPPGGGRRVTCGPLWCVRTGARRSGAPACRGPRTTLCSRYVRWRAAGMWRRILDAVSEACERGIVMTAPACGHVHPHGVALRNVGMEARDVPLAA